MTVPQPSPLGKEPPSDWNNDTAADGKQYANDKTDTEKLNTFVALYGFIRPRQSLKGIRVTP
jgi:hypothetical protein